MNILDSLAQQYGTDKRIGDHSYTEIYNTLFELKRHQIKKILEIGVYKGASLRMWKDYFYNADVFGIDIHPKPELSDLSCFIADQSVPADLEKVMKDLGGEFDLIVDDGSHKLEDQITSYRTLAKYVKKGGLYIIEDIGYSNEREDLTLDIKKVDEVFLDVDYWLLTPRIKSRKQDKESLMIIFK